MVIFLDDAEWAHHVVTRTGVSHYVSDVTVLLQCFFAYFLFLQCSFSHRTRQACSFLFCLHPLRAFWTIQQHTQKKTAFAHGYLQTIILEMLAHFSRTDLDPLKYDLFLRPGTFNIHRLHSNCQEFDLYFRR